ncbi:cytoplasmic tRNA 2-thiolation protein 1 [Clonorchis sinensis]|uniref:Cytoplasmic tRNA 2-thiolation protein 1 n=1 Tax=Clonorchis sinensis TaxID=79923 RepID=G7YIH5_CLOSI|nr:cytoplasmic tRNA 2-thiolation protein 1 [Clonorchis sinensis]
MRFTSPQEAQKIMLECFRRAEECREIDEEVAYILFRRYFDFYEELKKLTSERKAKVNRFCDCVISSYVQATVFTPSFKKQCLLAMDYLERLHESLKLRYDSLPKRRSPTPLRLPSPPRDPIFEIKPAGQKPSCDTEASMVPPKNDGWISVKELAGLLKRKCNVLVIDIRPEEEYNACHLKWGQLLNAPADRFLLAGTTFSQLSSKIVQGPSKDLWNRRGEAEVIVLVDKESGTEDSIEKPIEKVLPRTHPLRLLKDALFKWDAQRIVTKEPRLVLGGMHQFLLRYAPLTSNPQHRMELVNRSDEGRVSLPTAAGFQSHKLIRKDSFVAKLDDIIRPELRRPVGRIDYPQLNVSEPAPVEPEVTASEPRPCSNEAEDSSSLGEPNDQVTEPAISPETTATEPAAGEDSSEDTLGTLDLDERLRKLRIVKPKPSIVCPTPPQADKEKVPKIDRSRKPGLNSPSLSATALSTLAGTSVNGLDISESSLDQSKRVSSDETVGRKILPSGTDLGTPASVHSAASQPQMTDSSIPAALNGSTEPLPQFPSCHLRPTGLRNLGNTCYMNAVLQSLAHTRALATFFLRGLDDNFMNRTNPLGYGGTVSTNFRRLFTALWSKLDCYEDLTEFKRVVGRARSTFAGSEQQDSLEFLIFLLDGLHEDMNEGTRTIITGDEEDVDEEHLDPKERSVKAWEDYLRRNKSVIVSSFQSSAATAENPIPRKIGQKFGTPAGPASSRDLTECRLPKECVSLFGSLERMDASYLCGRCKRKTDATKRLIVWRLPTYLIIHLKRFHYVNDEWQKRTTYVRFPVDSFQLQQNSPSYALYAVVVAISAHLCSMITPNPVHFILPKDTAFCRGISDGFWYEYDDSTVTRIPESRIQVTECAAPGRITYIHVSRYLEYRSNWNMRRPGAAHSVAWKHQKREIQLGSSVLIGFSIWCHLRMVVSNARSAGLPTFFNFTYCWKYTAYFHTREHYWTADSTVLAYVMKLLNERHHYGAELLLLSIDEGISGYRDESLETVKRNQMQYDLPLTILSYEDLFGWSMDAIVQKVGNKRNCTFCGIFRRQALDKGAVMLQATKICTGHNADDVAETVLMNILRGDIGRLKRCTAIVTGCDGVLPRFKPFKYTYEKEIVMYARLHNLDYFSTECKYAPNAYRGYARTFLKDLERFRPRAILDIIHSGEQMAISQDVKVPVQARRWYATSAEPSSLIQVEAKREAVHSFLASAHDFAMYSFYIQFSIFVCVGGVKPPSHYQVIVLVEALVELNQNKTWLKTTYLTRQSSSVVHIDGECSTAAKHSVSVYNKPTSKLNREPLPRQEAKLDSRNALLMSSNKSETRVQRFSLVWTHRNNYARTGGRPFKLECRLVILGYNYLSSIPIGKHVKQVIRKLEEAIDAVTWFGARLKILQDNVVV